MVSPILMWLISKWGRGPFSNRKSPTRQPDPTSTRRYWRHQPSNPLDSTNRCLNFVQMVKVDPSAPTNEENQLQAVTKLRYMMFREKQSSSCSLGFRIEAIKASFNKDFIFPRAFNFNCFFVFFVYQQFQGKPPVSELKTVQTREAVQSMLEVFLGRGPHVRKQLIARLKHIRQKFQDSPYFQTHEVLKIFQI